MKQTRSIMGMPITIEILDPSDVELFEKVFDYFNHVDEKFSTYKETSEISRYNAGLSTKANYSPELLEIFKLADETRKQTNGYFDIRNTAGKIDPSGIVKGWAIKKASDLLKKHEVKNFYIDAGGDIQVAKPEGDFEKWSVGIQNPLKNGEIVKVVYLRDEGLATSGTYNRGKHIYNPVGKVLPDEIVSLTVVGPNIYEADRFATAAFAMGKKGIYFIENLVGFEGYQINKEGIATETTGFNKYLNK